MRVAFAMILALGLAACETTANDGGAADYDALARASADCKVKGGSLVLKDGGDSQYIQDYACKGK